MIEHGPALAEPQIRNLAPSLPDHMVRSLARQRADEHRVANVAHEYALRTRTQERATAQYTEPAARPAQQRRRSSDPVAEWTELVAKHRDRGLDQRQALRAAVAEDHELHIQYLEAVNAGRLHDYDRRVGRA